jgi:hypothetical protein
MKLLVVFINCFLLTSCTFNVSMAHTQGTATDVIDDTSSNNPNVSPTLKIPATL